MSRFKEYYPDSVLYVDRSYTKNKQGKYQVGYAVTTEYEFPERSILPQCNSAQ